MVERSRPQSGESPLPPDLRSVTDRATDILREMIGPSGPSAVDVHWSTIRDAANNMMLVLRLGDAHTEAQAVFNPAELTGDSAWFRLSRVYRDLLRERVHQSLPKWPEPTAARVD